MAEVGHGTVRIDVDDEGVAARLRQIDNDFKRQMEKLDGKEAEVHIKGDLDDLKRDLKETDALVKQSERNLTSLEKERKNAANQRATALTKQINKERKLLKTHQQEASALRGATSAREADLQAIRKENQLKSVAAQRTKAEERQEASLAKAKQSSTRARQASATATARENQQVAKLQQQHKNAEVQLARLNKQQGKKFTPQTQKAIIEIDKGKALADMARVRRQLDAMGEKPIDIDVSLNEGGGLQKFGRALLATTVRVGPFTTSILGLGRVMAGLGPIVTGLAGSTIALAGVVGTGLVGASIAAGSAIAGFGLASIGIFAIMKPLVKEYGSAKTALNAYNQAALKNGKNSEQAKKKLGEFRNVVKNMDPAARQAFTGIQKLSASWRDMTQKQARPIFAKTLNEGVKTATALMPMFKSKSMDAFKAVNQGTRQWMTSLRSPAAKQAIGDIMGSFNKALPSIMGGLGSLGGALGRVLQSGSRSVEPLAKSFERWSQGISDGSQKTGNLNSRVDRLVGHAKSLGRFFMAGGRALGTFFSAGANAGKGLLDTMTASLNKWNAWMQSIAGQKSLSNFFKGAVGTTKNLFNALAPLATLFVKLSAITQPFTNALLNVVSVAGKVVNALMKIPGAGTAIQAVAAAFFAAWSVGKIADIAGSLARVRAGLMALGAAGVAARAATGVMGGLSAGAATLASRYNMARNAGTAMGRATASTVPMIAPLGNAMNRTAAGTDKAGRAMQKTTGTVKSFGSASSTAAAPVARTAATAGRAGALFSRFGAAATVASTALIGISAPALAIVGAVGAAGYGIVKAATQTSELGGAAIRMNAAVRAGANGVRTLAQTTRILPQAQSQVVSMAYQEQQAQARVNQMRKAGQTGTLAYKSALADLTNAQVQTRLSQEQSTAAQTKHNNAAKAVQSSARARLDQAKQEQSLFARGSASWNKYSALVKQRSAEYQAAVTKASAATVNLQRANAGLVPFFGRAAQTVGKFARSFGQLPNAKKFVLKADDTQAAGKIASVSNKLKSAGKGKTVAKIFASSTSAEQVIKRLTALLGRVNAKKTKVKVDAEASSATSKVQRLQAQINRIKQGRVPGLDANDAAAKAKVRQLQAQIRALKGKTLSIRTTAGSAVGPVQGLAGAVASLRDKTINITANVQGGIKGSLDGLRAKGGPMTARDKQASRGRPTAGGVASKPTFLVGEEYKPEYVIATNPSYRSRNEGFLAQAANDFGYRLTKDEDTKDVPGFARGRGGRARRRERKRKARDRAKTKAQKYDTDVALWITRQQNEVSVADSAMSAAQSSFNKRGWATARNQKTAAVNQLISNIQQAMNPPVGQFVPRKPKGVSRGYWNKQVGKYIAPNSPDEQSQFKADLAAAYAARADNVGAGTRFVPPEAAPPKERPEPDAPAWQVTQAALESNLATAEGTPSKDDDKTALRNLYSHHGRMLSYFKGQKSRARTNTQRLAAQQGITESIQSMNTYRDRLNEAATTQTQSAGAFNNARYDMLKSYGGNSKAISPGTPGNAGGGSGSGGVNITNNYAAPPPDPHTWSQQQGWESSRLGVF